MKRAETVEVGRKRANVAQVATMDARLDSEGRSTPFPANEPMQLKRRYGVRVRIILVSVPSGLIFVCVD